jgi:hypothetical protein
MHRSAPIRDVIVHGVIGGIIAGLVVSLWFLGIDLIQGQPLATPAVLGQIVMQLPEFAMSARLMLGYTVLHFGVFIGLGIAAIWFLRLASLAPSLLLGLVFGVVAIDVVYYGALLVSGGSVFEVLEWYQVVPANALAGMALMAYLHRAFHHEQPLGLGVMRGHPRLVEGVVNGLIGAAIVAAWFFVVDLVNGRPLYTPAAVGSALFLGAQSETEVRMTLGVIAGFTVVHVALFSALGVLLVGVADYLERKPSRVLMVVMAAVVLDGVMVPTLALTAGWVLGALGIWEVVVANLLAVVAMVWHAWRTHPALRDRLEHAHVDV